MLAVICSRTAVRENDAGTSADAGRFNRVAAGASRQSLARLLTGLRRRPLTGVVLRHWPGHGLVDLRLSGLRRWTQLHASNYTPLTVGHPRLNNNFGD